MLIKYLRRPPKLDYMSKWLNKDGLKVLDIGCGDHSPSITKSYFPNIKYYGLDRNKNYNQDENDFKCMEDFYEIDLTKISDLARVPDNFFDFIIMSHVIEHLENGDKVIEEMLKKLNSKGIIYIEFPSPHSVHLPKMKGTLNFYDDPTHIRVFTIKEVENIINKNGLEIIKSGIRRSPKKILLLPLYAMSAIVREGRITSSVFWDITGFASRVVAVKK